MPFGAGAVEGAPFSPCAIEFRPEKQTETFISNMRKTQEGFFDESNVT